MSKSKSSNATKKEKYSSRIFYENPYDIETFFEALGIAADHGKELQYVDQFIARVKSEPTSDTATTCFEILRDFELIKFED